MNSIPNDRERVAFCSYAGLTPVSGIGVPIGFAIAAHGADHFFTGLRTVIGGRQIDTVTSHLLQKAGASPETANFADNALSMGGTMVGSAAYRFAQGAILSRFHSPIATPSVVPPPLSLPSSKDMLKIPYQSTPKNVFPKNPKDLLPTLSRNSKGHIYPADNLRIRAEIHEIKIGDVYNPRHHGQHYHVEYRSNPSISWSNKNNIRKYEPDNYKLGDGTGFLPGERFPGLYFTN
jgi:hypothetical protein